MAEVVADNMQMLGSKPGAAPSKAAAPDEPEIADDIPF
jgi:hypothetical protein